MIVKFSRHARRRAKLYKIPEDLIREILADTNFCEGEHDIIKNVPGFKYPMKVVVVVQADVVTVVTNYPLKRQKKDERSL